MFTWHHHLVVAVQFIFQQYPDMNINNIQCNIKENQHRWILPGGCQRDKYLSSWTPKNIHMSLL